MTNHFFPVPNGIKAKVTEFLTVARKAGLKLPGDPGLIGEMETNFAYSAFVVKHCLSKPQIIGELIDTGDLFKSYASDDYTKQLQSIICEIANEQDLAQEMHRFRLKAMIRIIWRDLAGRADLFETMSDLSNLADACIQNAFGYLYDQAVQKVGRPRDANGKPQNIVVLGMGKLGAFELNLSSDIDLIFAYPESGKTDHPEKAITNEEFFVKLCQQFLKLFSSQSADGILFRVDMRLRPFGANGPLVMNFNVMEDYYQSQGREWERYALIKARVVAGDLQAGELLLARLKPFIYRRYLDYGTYDALRDMKQRITTENIHKGLENNIKLGPGGIREIEFFVQVFQLIRGGVDSILQERSALKVLRILVAEGYIPQHVKEELQTAYIFLRNTEHRLQAYEDQQVHSLPVEANARLRLANAMGFGDWQEFNGHLQDQMRKVHLHFNEILAGEKQQHPDSSLAPLLKRLWTEPEATDENVSLLESLGYQEGRDILNLLDLFLNSPETRALSHEGRDRVDKLMPLVLQKVGETENPSVTIRRILDLIKTIERRTCYIALILESPSVLEHLIKLAGASSWITSFLSRHPVLLDELLDSRTLFAPPDKVSLKQELRHRLERLPDDDIEFQIESLCVFKQINVLRVAAADITGHYPLMRVSDHLTDIAEVVVAEVLEMAWRHLVAKHGRPQCELDGKAYDIANDKGFAVIAYGKLGGIELGYGSDLDMVFIHAGTDRPTTGTASPIDTYQFYVRLGQRVVHLLTSHTRAGRLYEVDMRLRPSGSSGLLVSSIDAFKTYQSRDAWTWEHQALVRSRIICGDHELSERFGHIRQAVLSRRREKTALRKEIRDMRERMRNEHLSPDSDFFDLKQSPGGIVDIEFLVQYLVLLNANDFPAITRWTDNIRLLESLQASGILSANESADLKQSYLKLRSAIHRLNLEEKPGRITDTAFDTIKNRVVALWNQFVEND